MKRRLFIPIAIALIFLVGYNVLVALAAKKTQRHELLSMIDHLSPSTDCLFLGNSLIEAGCNARAFESGWSESNSTPLAVNLGLGATTPVEHYLILKRAFEKSSGIKYVIYGFYDDQLNTTPDGAWEQLVGNRALSYYFPNEAAPFYTPNSRLGEWRLEMTQRVPMLAERSSLWNRVELLRRQLQAIGMPEETENRFGRADDFNLLESKDAPSFVQKCNVIVQGRKGFSAPIQAMLDLAHEHGAIFIFVEMPMSPKHRETFYSLPVWTAMRAHLQTLAQTQQVTYITASDWVNDDAKFLDAIHLNEEGARFFSARLGTTISRMNADKTNRLIAAKKH
jgi:hypothetical protein